MPANSATIDDRPQVVACSAERTVDVEIAGRTTGRIGATGPQLQLAASS
jgi:hypothetical protein